MSEVSSVQLANLIEDFIDRDWNKAREIADEILRRYELTPKTPKRKSYEGRPRGGGAW